MDLNSQAKPDHFKVLRTAKHLTPLSRQTRGTRPGKFFYYRMMVRTRVMVPTIQQ